MHQTDHFNRTPFAIDLLNRIKELPTPFSIGLDADWGAGKSFFINNVLQPLALSEPHKFPVIVYDAFEHEKEDDVFLSLMTSILEQSQELLRKQGNANSPAIPKAIEKTAKVATAIGSVVMNAGSRFLLRQSFDEVKEAFGHSSPQMDSLYEDLEKDITKFLSERLRQGRSYKVIKTEFQTSIKELAYALSNKYGKILVVIDELDRCKPFHALQVLEATNHILNTSGLIFMFSYNREQLESLVEHVYGKDIKASEYLQKFVTINLRFPKLDPHNLRLAQRALIVEQAQIHKNVLEENDLLRNTLGHFAKWSQISEVTPRQLQHFTSLSAVIKRDTFLEDFLSYHEIAFLMFLKLKNPRALKRLLNPNTVLKERKEILAEVLIEEHLPPRTHDERNLIRFLSDEIEASDEQRAAIYSHLQVFNVVI